MFITKKLKNYKIKLMSSTHKSFCIRQFLQDKLREKKLIS